MSSTFRILDYNYLFDETVTVTGTTEDSEFPLTNLQKYFLSKIYRSTSSTAQRIVIDLGTQELVDMMGIQFDRQEEVKISPLGTLRFEANPTNVWTSPLISVSPTIDDVNHCVPYFWTTAVRYRYWSIYYDEPLNPYAYLEIPKIWLGKSTQLNQMPEIGFKTMIQDQSLISMNKYGYEYADVYPARFRFEVFWKHLIENDKQLLREIYYRCGKVKPLWISLDPEAGTFDDANEHLFYGFLDNEFETNQTFYSFFDSSMKLRGAL